MHEYMTIEQAATWASENLKINIEPSNISYLIQYGKVKKIKKNGTTVVELNDLKSYYNSYYGKKELNWKKKLGDDLNWSLSFDNVKEKERTKHVHRLHPYKGKFIPQLVEYFLDNHTDQFKKEIFFKKGDVILDPFCGSGTTLVQANELGINAVGIDVSEFNALISNVKVSDHDLLKLEHYSKAMTHSLEDFVLKSNIMKFENELLDRLKVFNNKYFPSPDFKYRLRQNTLNEKEYGKDKEQEFLPIYFQLLKKYNIEADNVSNKSFIDKWYMNNIRKEIDFMYDYLINIDDSDIKRVLAVVLSRTIRSCRATTHSDLATLKSPVFKTYYCRKHKKICKPLFSILKWWKRYSQDTINRLYIFRKYKTDTSQYCLIGDSKNINIFDKLKLFRPKLALRIQEKGFNGIFTSPPYVGLIDYHQQHAYSYELLGLERRDSKEIGPMFKGHSRAAVDNYVDGVAAVLKNSKE